ncbi:MAG: response regulator [Oscillospiraceae bacterium]|jgi:putative two-component system response regulator|nr:response regulator [Oscillospiraceae bacterium]
MKKILVVDDNITGLKQIGAMLDGEYDVTLAKSGELALKVCTSIKPDLIILDIEMPEPNGFAIIAALKATAEFKSIPVIFLTANDDAATEVRALESGAVDFITKPVNREILRHRVELHLSLHSYSVSLEASVRELEDSIVDSFALIVELKEPLSGRHPLRAGVLLGKIGERLIRNGSFPNELDSSVLVDITRAAAFHDIGKIGVSDLILNKPGPLTDEEYAEAKQHTLIGAHLVDTLIEKMPNLHYLQTAKLLCEGHHERYDGSGYPHGKRGEEIPLCCRILSVANVYDACISDRIYRRALGRTAARRIISEGRGTVFDPVVTDAFCEIEGELL